MAANPVNTAFEALVSAFSFLVPVTAVVWVLSVPQRMGFLVYPEQTAAFMLGAALFDHQGNYDAAFALMLASIPVFVWTGTMPTTVAIQKMVTAL